MRLGTNRITPPNLASHLQRRGQTAAARETIAHAVEVLTRALGKAHPDTQRAIQTAADISPVGF